MIQSGQFWDLIRAIVGITGPRVQFASTSRLGSTGTSLSFLGRRALLHELSVLHPGQQKGRLNHLETRHNPHPASVVFINGMPSRPLPARPFSLISLCSTAVRTQLKLVNHPTHSASSLSSSLFVAPVPGAPFPTSTTRCFRHWSSTMASEGPPTLPVPLAGLVKHLGQHPETPIVEILEPYRKYEAHLRRAFAQDPDNELLKDPHVNVFPLFTEDTHNITIRARNLKAETKEEKSKYIMPLPTEVRRPDGSPAIVQSLKEFQRNFSVFSESSLVELDWYVLVSRHDGRERKRRD